MKNSGWLPTYLCILLLLLLGSSLMAQSTDTTRSPMIHPGAIEIGVAGSLTAVEGISRASAMLRGGSFLSVGSMMSAVEAEAGYSHTNALGALDLQGSIALTGVIEPGVIWPYLAFAGGIRQEFLGSFSQIRYPVGGDLGARLLVAESAAIRLNYRYRRVLGDPVADYSEHQILLGISILLGNRR